MGFLLSAAEETPGTHRERNFSTELFFRDAGIAANLIICPSASPQVEIAKFYRAIFSKNNFFRFSRHFSIFEPSWSAGVPLFSNETPPWRPETGCNFQISTENFYLDLGIAGNFLFLHRESDAAIKNMDYPYRFLRLTRTPSRRRKRTPEIAGTSPFLEENHCFSRAPAPAPHLLNNASHSFENESNSDQKMRRHSFGDEN